VARVFAARKGRCGTLTLTRDLHEQGWPCNRKTVAASQRRQGLRAKAARKFKATTNSNHNLPVAPNRLQQNFTTPVVNQKWGGDITYLWTEEGWLYLAVVIDLYSRRVVDWAMAERMTSESVCAALTMALVAPADAERRHRAHRPRQPVLLQGLSVTAPATQAAVQHEPQG
jgi:putative transposase